MQFITGRIVTIEAARTIKKTDNEFSTVTFVIKKRMKKKVRNIAFKCYGKLADEIGKYRINDKIEVEFLMDSNQAKNPLYKDSWFTNLHAVNVWRSGTREKFNYGQLKIEEENDKIEEGS